MLNSPLLVKKNEANLLYYEQLITRPFSRRKVVEKFISQVILVISQDIPWNVAYHAEYAK